MKMPAASVALFAFALLACATGCPQGPVALVPRPKSPATMPAAAQPAPGPTYTEARAQFQTNLVRRGPAPQRAPRLKVPADVSVVTYESDGRKLKAWVSKAATAKGTPKPAVLFLHGGFAFGEDDWEQTLPLRQAGFHVMVPLLRGENGQPGDFTLHVGETDDALAAGELLATLPGVDARNLFVSGHSVGGTLAMFVALASDKFRGAAPISGAPDCRTHLEGQEALAPFDTSNPREFDLRSPTKFATQFRCPVRCYYGTEEAAFFSPDTRMMAAKAALAGKDVVPVQIPGDHGSVVEPALEVAITFFRERMAK